MAAPEFYPVTLLRRWDEAEGLVGLEFDLGESPIARTFANPGMYVQIRLPSGLVGYYAIASAPGASRFEFLIKLGGELPDAFMALPIGATVEMSEAAGRGYPIQHQRGKDILLLAVGSGLSPIRSLIYYLAAHRAEYAGVTLFYGARSRAHMPYRDEVAVWQREGIQVVQVLSRPGDGADATTPTGYVQHALGAHPIDPDNTVAFVCGMKPMVEGVTSALAERGVSGERIFQNF